MSEAESIVKAWDATLHTADGQSARDNLIELITTALDAARVEGAAAEHQRCAEIARDTWAKTSIGKVAVESQAEYERNAIVNAILDASPDPNYAQRIRDEVWDEAILLAKSVECLTGFSGHWQNGHSQAKTVIIGLLEAAKRKGTLDA